MNRPHPCPLPAWCDNPVKPNYTPDRMIWTCPGCHRTYRLHPIVHRWYRFIA